MIEGRSLGALALQWVQGRALVEGTGVGVTEYATERSIFNFVEMKVSNL